MALARSARALGARASSAFGAGFGGSVWALVAEAESDAFTKRWAETYRRDFPAAAPRAVFFTTRPGPAATAPYGRTVRLQAD
jgi:galactokinase